MAKNSLISRTAGAVHMLVQRQGRAQVHSLSWGLHLATCEHWALIGDLDTPVPCPPASTHVRRPMHLCPLEPGTPTAHPVLMEPDNVSCCACSYEVLHSMSLCIVGKLKPRKGQGLAQRTVHGHSQEEK